MEKKALGAGINIAKCSSGVPPPDDEALSAKGIIGSMVRKLGKEIQKDGFCT